MQLSIEPLIWWLAWSGWLLKAAVELKSLAPAWAEQWSTQKRVHLFRLKHYRQPCGDGVSVRLYSLVIFRGFMLELGFWRCESSRR